MTDLEYLQKYMEPSRLEEGIEKLKNNIPVQYIVGNVDFYNVNLIVNENVLIPRFETEELVEKTIEYANDFFNKEISILDIGTGSGCIALSLKKNLHTCSVDAVDISEKALGVALENAERNKLEVNFFKSDIFENVHKKYDLIISNPPYIAYDEEIMDIVKQNEPHLALYAEDQGYYFYEEIIKNADNYLNDKGMLAFEIGQNQGKKIKEFVNLYMKDAKVVLKKDLQDRNRFIFVFKA